ncbi:MAG: DUF1353 domain-containing protein [Thiohalocapsa sp.]
MAKCHYAPDSEKYPAPNAQGPIQVEFNDIPPVRLQTVMAKEQPSWLERVVLATKPRVFSLGQDWCIKLDKVAYDQRLNGSIVIPKNDVDGEPIEFDGASIPLPWLVSVLTFGILRPLGLMLTASLVHDYAYKFGHLLKDDGTVIEVERDVADRLFRDIIISTTGLSFVGYIGWIAVRLGWPFVKYNHKRMGGAPPLMQYLSLLFAIGLISIAEIDIGIGVEEFVTALVGLYAAVFAFTKLFDRRTLVAKNGDNSNT